MMETLTRLWQRGTNWEWDGRDGAARIWKPRRRHAPVVDVVKGVAAGMIGGVVASWLMNQFQAATSSLASKFPTNGKHSPPHQKAEVQEAEVQESEVQESEVQESEVQESEVQEEKAQEPQQEEPEPSTVQAAEAVAAPVLHRKLTPTEKQVAGPAVHYGYGTLMGGLYGGLVEVMPEVSAGFGTAFGTAVFVGGDEIGVPLFGLSQPPWKVSASTHANAFGAHLVYGLTTEGVRCMIRRIV